MEKTNMSIHVGMTNCDKILELFKTLSNEKKLEVFIKLRDILWETKDAIHEREESSAYFNQAILRLRQRNDS
jgi:DNA-binding transcriptional ArsR family regulator